MSTRAIITVKSANGKEVPNHHAHGDGYPSTVGMMVWNFAKLAPRIDQNAPQSKRLRTAAWGDFSKGTAGRYRSMPGIMRAASLMANTSVEPDKFVPALIAYMATKGYGGIYMTDRDPEKEAAAKGRGEEFGTDIEWHYVVALGRDYGDKLEVETYEATDYGPRKPLFTDEHGKVVTIGSLQKFVKRGPVPQLAIKERREQKRRIAAYEKEQRSKAVTLGEPSSVLSSPGSRRRVSRRSTGARSSAPPSGMRGVR